jgi:hypothetical protein
VVQAYFAPRDTPAQPASRLRKQLFGYARVHLAPGGAANVSFAVDSATLRMVDRGSGDTVVRATSPTVTGPVAARSPRSAQGRPVPARAVRPARVPGAALRAGAATGW